MSARALPSSSTILRAYSSICALESTPRTRGLHSFALELNLSDDSTALYYPTGLQGRGLHSFTLELNLSNSRTHFMS